MVPINENAPDAVLERLRRGGHSALAEVFAEQRGPLLRMVDSRLDRRVAGRIDPCDVLQEAYLDASRQLDRYLSDPPMSATLWLRFLTAQRLMAVHRQHLGVCKRDARQEIGIDRGGLPGSDSQQPANDLLGHLTSPSAAVGRNELQTLLRRAVADLEPLDREILALRHFQELSNQQAAAALGISAAAASKRYVRALEHLKRSLAGRTLLPLTR